MRKKERYWSRYAHVYDECAGYVVGEPLRRAIMKRLSGERDLGEVMECGCGTGYYTRAIAKNARHVVAADLSEEMLDAARQRLKGFGNISLRKADCEDMPFPEEGFDTVLMANVLHVLENPFKALCEAWRVLRNGGRLLIVSYTDYGLPWFEKVRLGLRYFERFGFPPPPGLRNYSPDELGALVEGAGFAVEENLIIGDMPKALFLKGRKR